MMKQEMRCQMVFQNKIRVLKQIELSKYGGKEEQEQQQHRRSSSNDISGGGQDPTIEDMDAKPAAAGESNNSHSHSSHHYEGEYQQPSELITGGATSPSQHQLSEELDTELFWDPEDDDQIFDFLMEH